jgi:tetratricopeptide (TPR) repeat protein
MRVDAAGNLAVLAMDTLDLVTARVRVREALDLAKEGSHEAAAARQWGNLALLDLRDGALDEARRSFLRAAEHFDRAGDEQGLAQVWNALGEVAMRQGEHEAAGEYFSDAFECLAAHGALREAAVARANQAHLLKRQGQILKARTLYQEVQAALGSEGDAAAGASLDLGATLMDLGDWPAADAALDQAETLATRPDLQARVALARCCWLMEEERLVEALEVAKGAFEAFEALSNHRGMVGAWVLRARLEWRMGLEPAGLPEWASSSDMADVQVALQALVAERELARGNIEAARRLSEDFEAVLAKGGERLRALKAKAFAGRLDYLDDVLGAEALSSGTMTISAQMAADGATADAFGVAVQPILPLILKGDLAVAEHLLGRIEWEERWPRGWKRSLARLKRFATAAQGGEIATLEEGEEAQDVETRALEAFINGVARGDDGARRAAVQTLQEKARTFLANLLSRSSL